nr:orphan G-protein coupled receptor 4 [Platynereis dumerilii]
MPPLGMDFWTGIFTTFYGLICIVGLVGNGLVIFVVLRYAKMKTVTNMYILNLAIADFCFLVGLPFLIVTAIMKHWIFGFAACKMFFILTSINWFTSVFTLTVMSADRYMAVVHPIRSMSYRTPMVALVVCFCVWCASLMAMLPIILYTTTVKIMDTDMESCTITWPEGQLISADKAFILYTLLLGFAIPVALTSVFYALVVYRLSNSGPANKSKEKRKSHRRVTKMVLTIISVYVVCWLPYWVFQVCITFSDHYIPRWVSHVFQMITVMSYANSMLNPVLYAFLSDNFRKSFIKAFKCATPNEANCALKAEHSVFPHRRGQNPTSTATTTATTLNASSDRTRNHNEEEDEDEEEEVLTTKVPINGEVFELNDNNSEKARFIQAEDLKQDGLDKPTAV